MTAALPLAGIGVGDHWEKSHLPALTRLQAEGACTIAAVVDQDDVKLATLEGTPGLENASFATSLEEALRQRPELRAVVSTVGDVGHMAVAQTAIDAGLHVLGEKPLAATLGEADALKNLVREARENNLVFWPCNSREEGGPWKDFQQLAAHPEVLQATFGEHIRHLGHVGTIHTVDIFSHYSAAAPRKSGLHPGGAVGDKLNHDIMTTLRLLREKGESTDGFSHAMLLDNTEGSHHAVLKTSEGIVLTSRSDRSMPREEQPVYVDGIKVQFSRGSLEMMLTKRGRARASITRLRYLNQLAEVQGEGMDYDHMFYASNANFVHAAQRAEARRQDETVTPVAESFTDAEKILSTLPALVLEAAGLFRDVPVYA